jgi:hypothetical protein
MRQGGSLVDIKLGEEDEFDGFLGIRFSLMVHLRCRCRYCRPSSGSCSCGHGRGHGRGHGHAGLWYPECSFLLRRTTQSLSMSLCLSTMLS